MGWMNTGMQAQQERDQMTRSRKMIGWCGIKEEEGVGRGTALLVYRSHVMRPCYVTCPYWVQHTCGSFWEKQVPHHSACKSMSLSTHAITHFLWCMGVFVQLLSWSQAWKEDQYWLFPYSSVIYSYIHWGLKSLLRSLEMWQNQSF